MITNASSILWIVVIAAFVWLVFRYGLGIGKGHDVAQEFEELDQESSKHPDVPPKDKTTDGAQTKAKDQIRKRAS